MKGLWKMRRYKIDSDDVKWTKYKIVVPTKEDAQEVMDALEHIHDSDIDTGFVTVCQLAHEYLTPEREPGCTHNNIIVDKELYEKLSKDEKNVIEYREWTITWDELNQSYKAQRNHPLEVDYLNLVGIGPAKPPHNWTIEMLVEAIENYESKAECEAMKDE